MVLSSNSVHDQALMRSLHSLQTCGVDIPLPTCPKQELPNTQPQFSIRADRPQRIWPSKPSPVFIEDLQEPADPLARSMNSLQCYREGELFPFSLNRRSADGRESARVAAEYVGNNIQWYRDYLNSFAAPMQPMDRACELVFCIPVALGQETMTLKRTIEHIRQLDIEPNRCEIVLNLNIPVNAIQTEERALSVATTIQEVNAASMATGCIPVRFFVQRIVANHTIGFVRKVLHDVVTVRHIARNTQQGDLILVRTDADLTYIHPQYARHLLSLFTANPNVDLIHGRGDFDLDALLSEPILFVSRLLATTVDEFLRNEGRRVRMGGPNAAMRARAYARVHGFGFKVSIAEDCDLDKRIQSADRHAHNAKTPFIADSPVALIGGPESVLETSARRAIAAIRNRVPVQYQWTAPQTKFAVLNPEIRLSAFASSPSLEAFQTGVEASDFIERIEEEIDGVIGTLVNRDSALASRVAHEVVAPLLQTRLQETSEPSVRGAYYRFAIADSAQVRACVLRYATERFAERAVRQPKAES